MNDAMICINYVGIAQLDQPGTEYGESATLRTLLCSFEHPTNKGERLILEVYTQASNQDVVNIVCM